MRLPSRLVRAIARASWTPLRLRVAGWLLGAVALGFALCAVYCASAFVHPILGAWNAPVLARILAFVACCIVVALPLVVLVAPVGLLGLSFLQFQEASGYRLVRVSDGPVRTINALRVGACLLYLDRTSQPRAARMLVRELRRAFVDVVADQRACTFTTPLGNARSYETALREHGFHAERVNNAWVHRWAFGPALQIISELTGAAPAGDYRIWRRSSAAESPSQTR